MHYIGFLNVCERLLHVCYHCKSNLGHGYDLYLDYMYTDSDWAISRGRLFQSLTVDGRSELRFEFVLPKIVIV